MFGESASSAPRQNTRPTSAACWSTRFSDAPEPVDPRGDQRLHRVGDPLERAAARRRRARAPSPRGRAGCPRPSRARARAAPAGRRRAPAARRRARGSARGSAGRARATSARGLPPPQLGRISSRSGRATQTISTGESRSARARCSTTSSSGSSAQCTSSKTSTSGCACASCSAQSVTAHVSSPARALLLGGAEHAERDREQVGDGLALAAEAELLERLRRRRVVGDPGGRLDHRGERPVGDALAVRQRAAAERRHALGAARRTPTRAASCRCPARRRR